MPILQILQMSLKNMLLEIAVRTINCGTQERKNLLADR
jgi:hypothetical protein